MGSSKKHKKESKKKKHRSRSRSPLDGEERERKRHKKHKDRKKERSPDVKEVPVDSHIVKGNGERSRSASADRDRRMREQRHKADRDKSQDLSSIKEASPPASLGGGGQDSLSIDETNRLRAKLGLKPLETSEKTAEDGKIKDDLGEFYHKPAVNIAEQQKSEKLRQKLQERKDRRKMELKLQTTTLGEASDEDDTSAWVKRSRESDKQKQEAAKRAAVLDEMDAVFGVSALVEEEQQATREASYSAKQLRGLRVAHDIDALGDERETILTLADKDVLAEDGEDVLVNVNMVDDEKYKKNIEDRKKARAGYKAYDDEADLEAAALGYQKPVLSKYDEDIDPTKAARQKGFVIGDEAALEAKKFRDFMRQERLQGGPDKRLESLRLPELRLASDYMDEHEINAKFKKPKKRGKGIRKKAKHEPIDVDDYDASQLETDDTDVKPEQMSSLAVDEEETEPDTELQVALARARRLRQLEMASTSKLPKVEELLDSVKEEVKMEEDDEENASSSTMVLDATAEFCRSLGDIPTYGQAGNRDHASEIIDFERAELEAEVEPEENAGAWSRVDVHSERPPDLDVCGGEGALGAEPCLGAGVAGALQLALSKGYLEKAGTAPAPKSQHLHLLAARNYSIEDKTYGEEEKHGRRERGHHAAHSGPLSEFREKAGFRPNIKLEYVDDDGRPLCPKEAFRYLSHKFHGKGPGKNKQEKRIKKAVQEGLMKKMSSTDTPLNTLQMLQDKQRETHSAFIVLSEEYVSKSDDKGKKTPKAKSIIAQQPPSRTRTESQERDDESESPPPATYTDSDEILVTAVHDTNSKLVELIFNRCREIPRLLMQIIALCVPYQPLLTKLTVRWGPLEGEALYEIAQFLPVSQLTDICLDDSPVPQKNYSSLLEHEQLRRLSLARCEIDDDDCVTIATKLAHPLPASRNLYVLSLVSNSIADVGACALAEALRSNRTLQHLNLAGNHVSDVGARELFRSMAEFPLTYEELTTKRQRFIEFLRLRRDVYLRCLSELTAAWMDRQTDESSRGSRRRTIAPAVSARSRKSGIPSVSVGSGHSTHDAIAMRADMMANDLVGSYSDPFGLEETVSKEGYVYSLGNTTLCFLNLAHNDLGYLSVVALRDVLQHQAALLRKTGSGLLRVIMEGNCLPEVCTEYTTIQDLLERAIQWKLSKPIKKPEKSKLKVK